jgi:dynein heavy chain
MYKKDLTTVTGDCMLASGIIAYLGAFPIDYRDEVTKAWRDLLN